MKRGSIIGIVIIAIAIGVIVSTYADSSTYGSFAEAKEMQKELHVVGKLNKAKEMYYEPQKNANYFSFYLVDNKGTECKVIFNGTKPQDFEKSEQIVLTGEMRNGEFYANKILMKCPSKYTQDKVEVTQTKAQANI
ncbi:MAG: cytochrome c maturation protein CcmE [Sphingobacteriales bacterium]|nr:MAG: cytochrome c maturation protein CcmE [Sphingobacteriales bacterium]TAF82214.1 MAG: cytochrome c maturation protein CcmE [Sphingobacteriales bacterium]